MYVVVMKLPFPRQSWQRSVWHSSVIWIKALQRQNNNMINGDILPHYREVLLFSHLRIIQRLSSLLGARGRSKNTLLGLGTNIWVGFTGEYVFHLGII